MATRIGSGIEGEDRGVPAFERAAERAADALDGAPADLAFVFAGPESLDAAEDGLAAVRERLHPAALTGCGAQGVVGPGRELETGGVAVWAASFGDAHAEPFRLEALAAGEDRIAITGMPDLDEVAAVLLLVDPYSFPVEPLLARLAEERPGLPVVGGLASAASPAGTVLLGAEGRAPGGAVGAVLRGVDVRACVSQGARPVGPEMTITAADGNEVRELASRPALERLKEAIGALDPEERMLAAQGLLLGIVIDENQPEYERGDFLVRGLLGVDEANGALRVGERVRVGQTVRMHVRDAASADEDLGELLDRARRDLPTPPAGALLFTCNGRGSHMFDEPDHDAGALERALDGAPCAGFFCAGEIGPVGPRNFVHGFTATMALFPGG
jgi:small ligand-binding sensory domain FIST